MIIIIIFLSCKIFESIYLYINSRDPLLTKFEERKLPQICFTPCALWKVSKLNSLKATHVQKRVEPDEKVLHFAASADPTTTSVILMSTKYK